MPTPLLETRQLSRAFGGVVAANKIDFAINTREIVSIIGPNGAGKTTFFNLITGIYKPTSGQILFEGRDVAGLSPDRLNALGIARTFQNIRVFANMTVMENVLVGQHARLKTGLAGSVLRTPAARREEAAAREKSVQVMKLFGDRLFTRLDDPASTLSYANRRRVEISRALASDPKLLLLDEPTAGMDPRETIELTDHITQIAATGVTMLIIEHKLNVVMGISNRIIVLDYGEKIAEGTPEEVQKNERVIEAYLGRKRSRA